MNLFSVSLIYQNETDMQQKKIDSFILKIWQLINLNTELSMEEVSECIIIIMGRNGINFRWLKYLIEEEIDAIKEETGKSRTVIINNCEHADYIEMQNYSETRDYFLNKIDARDCSQLKYISDACMQCMDFRYMH